MRKTLMQYTDGKFNYKKIIKIINGVKEENKLPYLFVLTMFLVKKRGIMKILILFQITFLIVL